MSEADERRVEAWLRRLRWALSSVPTPERDDILAETRAHLLERVERGASLSQALDGFGPAEVYARRFIDEMELSDALASQDSPSMLAAVARRVNRSLLAAGALFLVVFLTLLSLGMAITVAWETTDPAHVGLWVGDGIFFFGQVDEGTPAREVLGIWLYPVAALVIIGSWWLGRMVLIRTLRNFVKPI